MGSLATRSKESIKQSESIAWQWYDFTCPFCYVSRSRNKILEENGFHVIALPFQAHPDIPEEGVFIGERIGPMYEMLQQEAASAGLPLNWPQRLPNSRYALMLAELVRRHVPDLFEVVKDRLYAAHFALNEDLGSKEVVRNCLVEFGIGEQDVQIWLEELSSKDALRCALYSAERAGVQGTPAWMVENQLISGLQPRNFFQEFKGNI